MADRVGQLVGNYRLLSLLGKGGFAEVYLGEHVYLQSKAALKLSLERLADEDRAYFLAEARLLATLIHPHIVRVLDFGVAEDQPFLVMDYAPNGSLRQRHPRGSPLPLATIVSYVQQLANALQYAHEQKVIHRDIKPENMLLGARQEVLLSDFGVALLAQSTRSQSIQEVTGTAAYMAPEQFQGKPRPASDQYALGVVVYEWMSGVRPFNGSFTEIASQHLLVPPPPLRWKVPALTPEIEQVVFTALAKDPRQRFASMRAFATALAHACQVSLPPPLVLPASTPSGAPSHADLPLIVETHQKETTSPEKPGISLSQSSPPVAATPPSRPLPTELAQQAKMDPLPSGMTSSPGQVTTPSMPGQSTPPGISRRAILIGVAGLALVGVAGGSLAVLRYVQATHPSPAPRPAHAVPTTNAVMFGFNPQHTHFNPEERILSPANVSRLVLAWTVPTAGTISISSPAVVNGVVYIGSWDHNLYAIDATTGKVIRIVPTGDGISSSPAVVNGVVYIGSADHKLYALDAATGITRWVMPTGSQISSSPAVVNSVVYIGSADHKFYALDAATGKVLWTVPTGDQIISSPAVANGVVYVGSWDHKLYAIKTITGEILWTMHTGNPIFSSPAVANGVVYVGSRDSKLYALDTATGKIVWLVSTGDQINSSPAVANGLVYVGSKDSKLYALDATTGKVLWITLARGEIASSPMVANGVVYVGSWDHRLYAVDASTGEILWKTTTGNVIESSPTVVNGVVYVGSRDAKLYAFSLPGSRP